MNKRGHIKIVGNSVLGMQFRTCKNFWTSTDSSLVDSPKILANTKAIPQSLPLRFCEQNLIKKSCHSERSEESKNNPSLRDSAKQNRGNPPCKKTQNLQSGLPRRFCESARNDKFLDSSVASLSQNDKNSARVAESTLDSADFTTNAESTNKSQQTIEEIAVEVAEFLGGFGCETGLQSAKHSKSHKSPQDAPKTKLQTRDELT